MTDPIKTVTEPVAPVGVVLIGTGDGTLPQTGIAVTSGNAPNLAYTIVGPTRAIAVRFANAYVTSLVGLVTVGLTTTAIPAPDFLHLVRLAASLALAGPGVAFGKDLITVLGNLERKYPLMTGSV